MIGFDAEEVTPAHEAWYAVVGARPVGSGPASDEELTGLDDALPIVEAAFEWAWDHEDPRARHAAAIVVTESHCTPARGTAGGTGGWRPVPPARVRAVCKSFQ